MLGSSVSTALFYADLPSRYPFEKVSTKPGLYQPVMITQSRVDVAAAF